MIWTDLQIPFYMKGVKMNHKGRNSSIQIIGGDSETYHGEPICLQFYSEDLPISEIIWTDGRKAFKDFIRFLNALPPKFTYTIYFHNLEFDMVSLFYPMKERLIEKDREMFDFLSSGWHIRGLYDRPHFCIFTKKNKTVYVLDSSAFYIGISLKKLAEFACPDKPKLDNPAKLGKYRYGPSNKYFVKYSMRDAEIAYHVGVVLDDLHNQFDIEQSLSVAHFSSKIFRHSFMSAEMPFPKMGILYAALNSYHGGKNACTVPTGLYKDIYCIDIISAYPFAMKSFPAFSDKKLYKAIKTVGHPRALPTPFGIYCITGEVKPCKYPCLFDHNFDPLGGPVYRRWVTGFELAEAMRANEVRLTDVFGYIYEADKDQEPSPFKSYVDFFFDKKDSETNKAKKEFYKRVLNALYGKFIQTKRKNVGHVYDCDLDQFYTEVVLHAGGMFQPFIASLITGHTRSYIHRLEHTYHALHTSTDGVMSRINPKPIPGLGGIKVEAQGNVLIFRNKLYILYSKEWFSFRDNGALRPKILKYALHGFHGNALTLEEMYERRIYEYEYTKVNKLRESLRYGLQVNDFVEGKKGHIRKGVDYGEG